MLGLQGLVFFTLCVVFALTCWSTRPAAPGGSLGALPLVRSVVPPMLLGWCLVIGTASPLTGSLRLHPIALEAAIGQAGETLFRVGSGKADAAAEPDLLVAPGRGASDGEVYGDLATIATAHDAGAGLEVALVSRAVKDGALVTSVDPAPPATGDGTSTPFIGAVALRAGDALCIGGCDRLRYVFDGRGALRSAAATVILPTRTGPPGLLAPWAGGSAVYPLRTALRGQPEAAQLDSILFESPSAWLPVPRAGTWYALPLDPSVTLQRGGKPLTPACDGAAAGCTQTFLLTAGARTPLTVRVARVNFGLGNAQLCNKPQPTADELSWWLGENRNPACRLIDRRSFAIGIEAGPGGRPIATLKPGGREIVALGSSKTGQRRARLAASAGSADPTSVSLDSVFGGARPGAALSAAIDDFPSALRGFLTGEAPDAPVARLCQANRSDQLCAGDERRAIRFGLDEMRLPWMLLIVAIAAAAAVHLLSGSAWKEDRVDAIVLALAQFLLSLRAIIATEGVMIDPDIIWKDVYSECALAMVALPSVLIALRPRARSDWRAIAALVVFDLLVFAGTHRWLGSVGQNAQILLALALLALALRGLTFVVRNAPRWPVAGKITGRIGDRAVWLISALIALRLIAPLSGFKERVGPLAISTLYLPPLLIGFALLLAAAAREPAGRWRRGVIFAVLALLAVIAPALARDSGFTLVYIWPLLGIAAWQGLAWRREGMPLRETWSWIAPAPLTVLLGYVALVGLVEIYLAPPAQDAPLVVRLDYSAHRVADPGSIRLIAAVEPSWVAGIGNRNASQQMAQTIHLVQRTASLSASRYMEPSNLPVRQEPNLSALRDVHLTDNVAAVHLMAPFGRIAAFGLLVVLLAVPAGLCAGAPTAVWQRWPPLAGALAIWTVFCTAAYMILANLLIVPFTGRNIYLLAPSSGTDLLEGLVLLAMTVAGLRERTTA